MSKKTVRVASYNIRKARGLDQIRAPERIVEVINGLGADIVAVQEADHRLGNRPAAVPRKMIEKETDFQIVEVATSNVSLGFHGNAVLTRKSLGTTKVHHIPLTGLEPRGAVRVDFEDLKLSFIATHLGLLRNNRRKQLSEIRDASDDARPTIIAGDFNEWRTSRGLEPLHNRYTIHAPGQSFHARRPVAALDRIALSNGLQVTDAGVEQGALAARASDHLPIWADIELA